MPSDHKRGNQPVGHEGKVERDATKARLALIVSSERSGSTLLNVVLGANSQVVAAPELHLLTYTDFRTWRRKYPIALQSLQTLVEQLDLEADPGSIDDLFAGYRTCEVYEWLQHRAGPDRILLDKTPAYARRLDALERAERLQPYYVWLIRHPLGVVNSRLERLQDRKMSEVATKFPFTARVRRYVSLWMGPLRRALNWEVRRAVARWTEVNERLEAHLAHVESDRKSLVHFEDLVCHPKAVIERLCGEIGITMESAMLDPGSNIPRRLQWGLGDEKIFSYSGFNPRVADRWRGQLSESVLSTNAADLMGRLGYGKDGSGKTDLLSR